MKTKMIIGLLASVLMTACGGGGGGSSSSPSTSIAQLVKYPTLQCGGVDCLSGSTVSSSSFSSKAVVAQSVSAMSTGDSIYGDFKTSYDNVKSRLADVKSLIEIINMMADDESDVIQSCSDIPTTGTYTWNDTYDLTFYAGDESWNMGNGSVAMDHKILMEDQSGGKTLFQFNCDDTFQNLHVIYSGGGAQTESFSVINLSTNETQIQVVDIPAGTTQRNMGYFYSNGNAFTLAYFDSDTANSALQSQVIATTFAGSSAVHSQYLEFAWTNVNGADLDNVSFGDSGGTAYRGCGVGYRTGSPTVYDSSCNSESGHQNDKSALVTSLYSILLGDATAWSISSLNSITVDDLSGL